MPILNYTTSISPHKTVGEIQQILVKHGATSISIDYEGSDPVAVTFLVAVDGRWINYRLPSHHSGVYSRLAKDRNVPKRYKSEEQSIRVAWRIVKDWVEAQMAIIEAGVAELAEVFLPYAVGKNGETFFQAFKERPHLLLGTGNGGDFDHTLTTGKTDTTEGFD